MAELKKPKNEGTALALSFLVTGLGEMYLGKVTRGIIILMVAIGLGIAAGALSPFIGFGGWIIVGLYWVWQMFDTHRLYKELYPQVV